VTLARSQGERWLGRTEGGQSCWVVTKEDTKDYLLGVDCYRTASLYTILLVYVTTFFKNVNTSIVKSCFIIVTNYLTFIVTQNSVYQSVFVLTVIPLTC
jgi:hypothetical protein